MKSRSDGELRERGGSAATGEAGRQKKARNRYRKPDRKKASKTDAESDEPERKIVCLRQPLARDERSESLADFPVKVSREGER